jgi:hypothetical protein
MSRNIILSQNLASQRETESSGATPDNYASQIVKLIPVDIVGVYLGISNLIDGQKITSPSTIQWIVFFTILVITPFYLYRAAGVTDKRQIIIACFSFIIWSLSLGGPFASYFDHRLTEGLTIKFLGEFF